MIEIFNKQLLYYNQHHILFNKYKKKDALQRLDDLQYQHTSEEAVLLIFCLRLSESPP